MIRNVLECAERIKLQSAGRNGLEGLKEWPREYWEEWARRLKEWARECWDK